MLASLPGYVSIRRHNSVEFSLLLRACSPLLVFPVQKRNYGKKESVEQAFLFVHISCTKRPCRQNTILSYLKDFSACPAANDALSTEKLNILSQNLNSPAKSCLFVTSTMTYPEQGLKTKDSLLTRAAPVSQTADWLPCLLPTFTEGAAMLLKCQCLHLSRMPFLDSEDTCHNRNARLAVTAKTSLFLA